jgi:hypothetical protein
VSERADPNPAGRRVDPMERQRQGFPSDEELPPEQDERYPGEAEQDPPKQQGRVPKRRNEPREESEE